MLASTYQIAKMGLETTKAGGDDGLSKNWRSMGWRSRVQSTEVTDTVAMTVFLLKAHS